MASVIVLASAGTAAYFFYLQPQAQSPTPPPMTPQAQTERITSYLLIWKIEELKDHAVYLQGTDPGTGFGVPVSSSGHVVLVCRCLAGGGFGAFLRPGGGGRRASSAPLSWLLRSLTWRR